MFSPLEAGQDAVHAELVQPGHDLQLQAILRIDPIVRQRPAHPEGALASGPGQERRAVESVVQDGVVDPDAVEDFSEDLLLPCV